MLSIPVNPKRCGGRAPADDLSVAAADRSSEPGERYHALDWLRGGMMLLGLVLHSAASYSTVGLDGVWPYQETPGNRLCDVLLLAIHLFRMPLFFVLAGFFGAMLLERRGAGGFVRHRARRILAPLAAGWLLLYPLIFLSSEYARHARQPNAWAGALAAFLSPRPWREASLVHLWFLWYLVLFYTGALLLAPVVARLSAGVRLRAGAALRTVASSPWRGLLLALPLAACLYGMRWGLLDTFEGLVPPLNLLAAYALFFGFGWALYYHPDLLATFAKRAKVELGVALVLILALLPLMRDLSKGAALVSGWGQAGLAMAAGVATWLLVLSLTGLALRHCNGAGPGARYLADASYWMYLTHVPLTLWLAGILGPLPLHGTLKFVLVLAGTTGLTMLTYDMFVRSGWIGEALNGRRYPRVLVNREPASAGTGRG